jgi:malate dehydrogenase
LLPNTLIKHDSFVLQKNGVEKNLGIGKLVDYEIDLLQSAMPELLANIKKGEDFVNQ